MIMKKVTKFRDKIKLPVVKLYLDDLKEIEKIIKNDFKLINGEELVIMFIIDEDEYENSIEKLKEYRQKSINNLQIRVYRREEQEEVKFDLDDITEISLIFQKTNAKIEFDNQIEIKGVVHGLEKFILKKKQKVKSYVKNNFYISLLFTIFISLLVITYNRMIDKSIPEYILFCIIILLIFVPIYLINYPVSVIILEHKKENNFWKRNSDEIRLRIFSGLVGFVLGVLSTVLLSYLEIL